MTEKTQKQMVLEWLKERGSIDPLNALRHMGCYRLGAVIFNLRAEGYNIATRRMEAYSKLTGRKV